MNTTHFQRDGPEGSRELFLYIKSNNAFSIRSRNTTLCHFYFLIDQRDEKNWASWQLYTLFYHSDARYTNLIHDYTLYTPNKRFFHIWSKFAIKLAYVGWNNGEEDQVHKYAPFCI